MSVDRFGKGLRRRKAGRSAAAAVLAAAALGMTACPVMAAGGGTQEAGKIAAEGSEAAGKRDEAEEIAAEGSGEAEEIAAEGSEAAGSGEAEENAAPKDSVIVEYDNLRQLLLDGNLDLKQANDSYESTKKNYQELMEQMREEQAYMKFMAVKYEDTENEAAYSANAGILGRQASMLAKRIEALNRKTQVLVLEENADSYTMAAQSVMNSYNQAMLNMAAKEKSVQAKEAAYQAVTKKKSVGAATAAEVMEAADRLLAEQNLSGTYRQQADRLRFQLLSMLGLEDNKEVAIGAVPEPDLSEIDGIDFEKDKTKAVNNSSSVQNIRRSRAGSTEEIRRKAVQEAEAEGNAETEFLAAYEELQAAKLEYQAAQDAYESARIAYHSLQKKNQAGMLDRTEYLEGEAAYLEAQAKRGSAAMELQQALEDYRWLVKGAEETRG